MEEAIREEFLRREITDHLPCAVAFDMARALGVSPLEIGQAADRMAVRLVKCQLGLFGYTPEKRIVKPSLSASDDVKEAITNGLRENRLPCKTAWQIALSFGLHKLKIAGFCDGLGVKIGPCQLGAF